MKNISISQSEKMYSYIYVWVHLNPDEQIGLHSSDLWELSYVVKGQGTRFIGNQSERFFSGEVILIPPSIPHCWHFDNNFTDRKGKIENITILFSPKFFRKCFDTFFEMRECIGRFIRNENAVRFDNKKSAIIIDIMRKMKRQNDAERLSSLIKLIVTISDSSRQVVVGKKVQLNKEQERLKQIETYVLCNFQRSDLSIDNIARHVMMNRSAFCVFFKKATGKTFVAYLNDCRIEKACKLLTEKKYPVSEVCYQVGFNDLPYFSRLFKRIKGVVPSKYTDIFYKKVL